MKSARLSVSKPASVFLISVCFFLFSCGNGNLVHKAENSLENIGLKGEVRALAETVFSVDVSSGEMKKGAIVSKTLHYFDRNGNAIEDKYLHPDGTQRGRTTYRYNEKDLLIEKRDLDHNGDLDYLETYRYDEKGSETERNGLRPPDSQWNIAIYHDEKGALRKKSYHVLVKSQKTKTKFSYDEKGNQVEEKMYDSDDNLVSRRLNKFDEKGKLTETGLFNSVDTMILRITYKYDGAGRVIEEKHSNSNPDFGMSRICSYDENGNMIEEVFNYGENSTVYTFNYHDYDKTGNWHIKSEAYSSPKTGKVFTIITERVIGYY